MAATILLPMFMIAALSCLTEAVLSHSSSVKTVVHSVPGGHTGHTGHTVTHTVTHTGNTVTHTVTHKHQHPMIWGLDHPFGLPGGTTTVKTVSHGIQHAGGVVVAGPRTTTVTHTTHGIPHNPGFGYGIGGHPTGGVAVTAPGTTIVSHTSPGIHQPLGFGYGFGNTYGGIYDMHYPIGGTFSHGASYPYEYGNLGYGAGGFYGLSYPVGSTMGPSNYGFHQPLGYGGLYNGLYDFH